MPTAGENARRFLLWIDAVGGYWVCLGDEVVLGQPVPAGKADVPILGDLSSRHARIRRDGEGYLIEAIRPTRVNGRPVGLATTLADRDTIQLGDAVRLVFRRPHPLSATARLEFASRHRTQPSVDAVLLMADACVLGPRPQSHVVCPDWPEEVVLYRRGDEIFCRSRSAVTIDGHERPSGGRLGWNSHLAADHFTFSLEEIPPG